jgi:hypothetical protein
MPIPLISPFRTSLLRRAALLLLAGLAFVTPAVAQSSQHRTDLLDLALGTAARDLPEEAFIDFACGTGGGPPAQPIGGFTDFAKCAAEASGLHEVAFRQDDELEYKLLAHHDTNGAETNGGTRISAYPALISALFDDQGILRGLRAVSDTRIDLRERTNSFQMAEAVRIRYGADGWHCVDLPAGKGEEPIATQFVKQDCDKTTGGMLIHTEARLLRRAGETEINRDTGRLVQGQFESSARIEIREAGARTDATGRPL